MSRLKIFLAAQPLKRRRSASRVPWQPSMRRDRLWPLSGLGVARAALEFLKEKLQENKVEIRYGLPRQKLTNIEREVIDMDIMLKSAWLMVMKAVWMADNKKPNALESSMSKIKSGDVTTKITQKVVEILGPLGYSREFLAEKWFRDAKITDIYEGTGQINRLVVARQILGYSGSELR